MQQDTKITEVILVPNIHLFFAEKNSTNTGVISHRANL